MQVIQEAFTPQKAAFSFLIIWIQDTLYTSIVEAVIYFLDMGNTYVKGDSNI